MQNLASQYLTDPIKVTFRPFAEPTGVGGRGGGAARTPMVGPPRQPCGQTWPFCSGISFIDRFAIDTNFCSRPLCFRPSCCKPVPSLPVNLLAGEVPLGKGLVTLDNADLVRANRDVAQHLLFTESPDEKKDLLVLTLKEFRAEHPKSSRTLVFVKSREGAEALETFLAESFPAEGRATTQQSVKSIGEGFCDIWCAPIVNMLQCPVPGRFKTHGLAGQNHQQIEDFTLCSSPWIQSCPATTAPSCITAGWKVNQQLIWTIITSPSQPDFQIQVLNPQL